MRRRAVFVAVALTASVVGAFSGVSLSQASRAVACERDHEVGAQKIAVILTGDRS